jgi:hemoglobin
MVRAVHERVEPEMVNAGVPEADRHGATVGTEDRTGITEDMIATLVAAFYARVRADSVLAPIFEAKVRDWDFHLAKLCDFWSSVVLGSGRYHGQPMLAHITLAIGTEHFDRWVRLFEDTVVGLCPPAAAARFIDKARRIADSFELGMGVARGEIRTPTRSRRAGDGG